MNKRFKDQILGQCAYDGFYLINEMYGGYSYKCEKGSGAVSYAEPEQVIKTAQRAKMKVHLAGGAWDTVGRKGWGETVSPTQAKELLGKLKKAR